MRYTIGVDIGGSEIKAGLVKGRKVVKKCNVDTESSKGSAVVFSNVVKVVESLWRKEVSGIGIGCAGLIDDGVVLFSPNLPFKNFDLRKKVREKFKVKVSVENDADCFALAEGELGSAKGCENFIGLTLGTGVGSGVVIDGKLHHGMGEIGHVTIDFDGPRCGCGNKGCIEAYIGGYCVKKRLGKSLKEYYSLACKGNRNALGVFKNYGKFLGIGIANIINAFNPDVIVIGGNASKAWKFFNKSMKKEIKRALTKCPVVRSTLSDPGIVGASLLLKS
ncbi:ROK family protein [Nanoarchaeota archaeon]